MSFVNYDTTIELNTADCVAPRYLQTYCLFRPIAYISGVRGKHPYVAWAYCVDELVI